MNKTRVINAMIDHLKVTKRLWVCISQTTNTLNSLDFQRIARDMGNLARDMDIYRDGPNLIFSCRGDFADQETVLEFPESVTKRSGSAYNLKYINMFTKATGLCSSVQLMQDSADQDMPIVFRYGVANLGDVKFYLAPRVEE